MLSSYPFYASSTKASDVEQFYTIHSSLDLLPINDALYNSLFPQMESGCGKKWLTKMLKLGLLPGKNIWGLIFRSFSRRPQAKGCLDVEVEELLQMFGKTGKTRWDYLNLVYGLSFRGCKSKLKDVLGCIQSGNAKGVFMDKGLMDAASSGFMDSRQLWDAEEILAAFASKFVSSSALEKLLTAHASLDVFNDRTRLLQVAQKYWNDGVKTTAGSIGSLIKIYAGARSNLLHSNSTLTKPQPSDVYTVMELLKFANLHSLVLSAPTLGVIIEVFVASDHFGKAFDAYLTLKRRALNVPSKALEVLVDYHLERQETHRAIELIKDGDLPPESATLSKFWKAIIRASSNSMKEVRDIVDSLWMRKRKMAPVYLAIIDALVDEKRVDEAHQWFREMICKNLKVPVPTPAGVKRVLNESGRGEIKHDVLKAVCQVRLRDILERRSWGEIVASLQQAKEYEALDGSLICDILRALLVHSRPAECRLLLSELADERSQIILGDGMVKLVIDHIIPVSSAGTILRMIEDTCGKKFTGGLVKGLIPGLLSLNRVSEASEILQKFCSDVDAFEMVLLHTSVRCHGTFQRLLTTMDARSLSIPASAYRRMIRNLIYTDNFKEAFSLYARFCAQPRDASRENALLLKEMSLASIGDSEVSTSLLDDLWREMKDVAYGDHPNDLAFAQRCLLLSACVCPYPALAWKIYGFMGRKNISLDISLTNSLIAALCEAGMESEVSKILIAMGRRAPIETIATAITLLASQGLGKDVLAWLEERKGGKDEKESYRRWIAARGYMKLNDFAKTSSLVQELPDNSSLSNAVWSDDAVVGFIASCGKSMASGFAKRAIPALLNCGKASATFQLVEALKNNGILIRRETLNYMISKFARLNDLSAAERSLELLDMSERKSQSSAARLQKLKLSSNSLTQLVLAYLRAGNPERALVLMDTMAESGYPVTSKVCNLMIRALILKGDLGKAMKIYVKMNMSGKPESDVNVYTILTLLDAHTYRGDLDVIRQLYRQLLEIQREPDVSTLTIFIKAYSQMAKRDMEQRSLVPGRQQAIVSALESIMTTDALSRADALLWNTLLNAFGRLGDLSRMIVYFKQMQLSCLPDVGTYNALIAGYGYNGCSKEMNYWYQKLIDAGFLPSIETFKLIMDGLVMNKQYDGLSTWFDEARTYGTVGDACLWNIVLKSKRGLRDLSGAKETLLRMQSDGVGPDRVTYTTLLGTYSQLGDIKGAFGVLEDLISRNMELNSTILNELFLAYSRAGEYERLYEMFLCILIGDGRGTKTGCIFDDKIIEAFSRSSVRCTSHAFHIVLNAWPNGTDSGRIADLVSLLDKYNVRPGTLLLNSMMEFYIRSGEFDSAIELFERMTGERYGTGGHKIGLKIVAADMHTYGSLIKAYSFLRKSVEAAECWRAVRSKDWRKKVFAMVNRHERLTRADSTWMESMQVILNNVIDACGWNDDIELAEGLWDELASEAFVFSANNFNSIIEAQCRVGNFQAAADILVDEMVTVRPTKKTFGTFFGLLKNAGYGSVSQMERETFTQRIHQRWGHLMSDGV